MRILLPLYEAAKAAATPTTRPARGRPEAKPLGVECGTAASGPAGSGAGVSVGGRGAFERVGWGVGVGLGLVELGGEGDSLASVA